MADREFINEVYRIKELMLYEQFKEDKNRIGKYLDDIVSEKVGMSKLISQLTRGSRLTSDSVRDMLIYKIKNGDYGNSWSEILGNLMYLKLMYGVTKVLNDEVEKNPTKYEGLDKFLFGEDGSDEYPLDTIFDKIVVGEFCKDCKSKTEVLDELSKVVDNKKKVDEIKNDPDNKVKEKEIKDKVRRKQISQDDAERLMKKLYGDSFGLISFFTKGHVRRGQKILDKYNLRDSGRTEMGKNGVYIELTKPIDIKDEGNTVLKKSVGDTIKTTYVRDESILVTATEDRKYSLEIELRREPSVENGEMVGKIIKIIPKGGKVLQIKPKDEKITFKVLITGTERDIDGYQRENNNR